MNLQMHLHNMKSISDLTFSFPLEKGLYAITGENASVKSTVWNNSADDENQYFILRLGYRNIHTG